MSKPTEATPDQGMHYVYLGFFLFGLIFNLIGWGSFYYNQKTLQQSKEVEGTVIGLASRVSDGSTLYAPIFRYPWADSTIIQTSTMYTNPPMYEKGEKVKMFIDEDDPNEFLLDSFWDQHLMLVIFGGFGALIWCALLAVYFFLR